MPITTEMQTNTYVIYHLFHMRKRGNFFLKVDDKLKVENKVISSSFMMMA